MKNNKIITLLVISTMAMGIGVTTTQNSNQSVVKAAANKVSKSDAIKVANYLFKQNKNSKKGLALSQGLYLSTKSFDRHLSIKNMKGFTRVISKDETEQFILDITKSGQKFNIHFHGMMKNGAFGQSFKNWKWEKANKDFYRIYPLKHHIVLTENQLKN